MRLITTLLMLLFSTHAYSDFVNPMDYKGSKEQNLEVEIYITERVNKDYCIIRTDTCNKKTLEEMQTREREYFKKLTTLKNKKAMDTVINVWCSKEIDLCNYGTIFMMYQNEIEK